MMVWDDGALSALEDVRISPIDRGFTLGDGVFETVRLQDGRPWRADRHMARLFDAAGVMGLEIAWSGADLTTAIEACARANQEPQSTGEAVGVARVTVTRGEGGRGLAPTSDAPGRVLITVHPAPAPSPEPRLACVPHRRSGETGGLKTLSYAENVAALIAAQARGASDALMLDTHGRVSGAAAANVFWRDADGLATPALTCGCRAGVMREAVIEAAANLGTPVRESVVGVEALRAAEAVALTSVVRGVTLVRSIDFGEGPKAFALNDPVFAALNEAVQARD